MSRRTDDAGQVLDLLYDILEALQGILRNTSTGAATPETATIPAWDQLQRRAHEWQQATFPGGTVASKMAHLAEEIEEVVAAPDDLHEWADCMLLLMGAASVAGHTMTNVFHATYDKLEINKARRWGQPDERGVVKHV